MLSIGVTPIPPTLSPVPAGGVSGGPVVGADVSLRDALAALLDGGTGWVAVRAADGTVRGVLTLSDFTAASTPE